MFRAPAVVSRLPDYRIALLLTGHQPLQLLIEVLDDHETRGRLRRLGSTTRLDHQKPQTVAGDVVIPTDLSSRAVVVAPGLEQLRGRRGGPRCPARNHADAHEPALRPEVEE